MSRLSAEPKGKIPLPQKNSSAHSRPEPYTMAVPGNLAKFSLYSRSRQTHREHQSFAYILSRLSTELNKKDLFEPRVVNKTESWFECSRCLASVRWRVRWSAGGVVSGRSGARWRRGSRWRWRGIWGERCGRWTSPARQSPARRATGLRRRLATRAAPPLCYPDLEPLEYIFL